MIGWVLAFGFSVVAVALPLTVMAAFVAKKDRDGRFRLLDRMLLWSFSLFLWVAWFFEPSVVWLCGWEGLETERCRDTLIGRTWYFYASTFDPIFLNLPTWLRVACSLDTFLFGPFYLASVLAFAGSRRSCCEDDLPRWYRMLAPPFAGALIYSTILYFAYEVLAEAHRASLAWVALVNAPWTVAPAALLVRLSNRPRADDDSANVKMIRKQD